MSRIFEYEEKSFIEKFINAIGEIFSSLLPKSFFEVLGEKKGRSRSIFDELL